MVITYLRLTNVAGIMVGQQLEDITIDFSKGYNKITLIAGLNGSSKTSIISSCHPFAYVTSLDERSSLSYIIHGKNGYKEIHFINNDDKFIIKHYYKSNKDSHSVKSYFQMNGNELNENGNVTSFLSLVELHMGLTQEKMRLIRMGSNVNSFIDLKPAERKNYIGKLISEIDLCLSVHKKLNDDMKILKVLMSTNNSNLYNCHINDINDEKNKLSELENKINEVEKEKNEIQTKIDIINKLEKENNMNDLLSKRKDVESSLHEINKVENEINNLSLNDIEIDELIKERIKLSDDDLNIRSQINALKLSIDQISCKIEKLNNSIKKTSSNIDIKSLTLLIESLKNNILNTDDIIKKFKLPSCSYDDINNVINKLSSYNQIGSTLYSFGNTPMNLYLKLKDNNKSIDAFVKNHNDNKNSSFNKSDLEKLISLSFGNDYIITPNCNNEFHDCPYYRFANIIGEFKNKINESSYDDETIRYLIAISNNIDIILNEMDNMKLIPLPYQLIKIMDDYLVLKHLRDRSQLFDLSDIRDYSSMMKSHEIFMNNIIRLKQANYELSIYKNNGVDNLLDEIKTHKDEIEKQKEMILSLEKERVIINNDLNHITSKISLLSKYIDGNKYKSILESSLQNINNILIPLEKSSSEKIQLSYHLQSLIQLLNSLKYEFKILDNKINEYERLTSENELLKNKHSKLSLLIDAVSTKRGIPLIYIEKYNARIKKLTNDLLYLIFEGNLKVDNFRISADSFEIPYIKNGHIIPDIKYASQAEVSLMTMALSFALAHSSTGIYNILLLDEIDAGLDENNHNAFLKMLHKQMDELNVEQVIMISHRMMIGNIDIPTDVIILSDEINQSHLQNVIYKR